jgi:hypothetical protein
MARIHPEFADLGLQWVIERDTDERFVGRAYVCDHMAITDTEIGLAEAMGAERPEEHAEFDDCPDFDADEIFEGFTGLHVPADLGAEFDACDLFLVATDDDAQALAKLLAGYGTVSFNVPDRYEIHTWFERDCAHVELRDSLTDETVVEWRDADVAAAVEDGFLSPKDWLGTALSYAQSHGLLPKTGGKA